MPTQKKRHVDPENIPAFYKFRLSQGFTWSGSAEHGVDKQKQHTGEQNQQESTLGLHIEIAVAETNSKKIRVGDQVQIDFYFNESKGGTIGNIHKFKDGVHFFVNVPCEFLSHLLAILYTSTADFIKIDGTDLYRRSGFIYNVLVINNRVER
jgi:hypothetical protein